MALKNYSASAIAGGSSECMDAIDGSGLLENESCIVFDEDTVYFYYLDASSGEAESLPDIVIPDANAGNKRWKLVASIGVDGVLRVSHQGVKINSSASSNALILSNSGVLTADRVLAINCNDNSRTLNVNGDVTLDDWFDQSLKTSDSPEFTGLSLNNDLPIAHGGTAASTAAQALINLGFSATVAEINSGCDGLTVTAEEINAMANDSGTAAANIFFSAGRKVLLYEDTAPSGWTIETTLDDKLVYVTKGSGEGGQIGGTVHSVGSWVISGQSVADHTHTVESHLHTTGDFTLEIIHMPSHTHTTDPINGNGTLDYASYNAGGVLTSGTTYPQTSGATGGGTAHNHGNTGSTEGVTGSDGGQNVASSGAWRPAAYCCIIVTKS